MDTTGFSGILSEGRETSVPSVSPETAEDLGLDILARRLAPGATGWTLELLRDLPSDPAVIRYRQEVFRDLFGSTRLRDGFEALMPFLAELTESYRAKGNVESPFLQAVMRLGELELYVECVERLHALLTDPGAGIRSRGLGNLASLLGEVREGHEFTTLVRELPSLRKGLKIHRSVTLGVNLDDRFRPVDAAILSVNDTPFTRRSLLSRLFAGSDGDYAVSAPIHSNPGVGDLPSYSSQQLPLSPLFQDLDTILRTNSRQITAAVDRFIRVNTQVFASLGSELGFYLGAVRFAGELIRNRLPVCIPDIAPAEDRILSADGFYNVLLADRLLEGSTGAPTEIVTNRLAFDDDGRVFILTGPNQGGKTTYAQGIGVFMVLAQAGIFVPASHAVLSPADRIETHFPSQEKGRIDTGRLAEEAERLRAVFSDLTPASLVLLNESLSSTSPSEGMLIAEDLLKALRFLGSRAVYATHFHDLAFRCQALNEDIDGESRIVSLTAGNRAAHGVNGVQRTYRISPGPPGGLSYAQDIADRFGLNLSRLTERYQSRKTIPAPGDGELSTGTDG